MDLFFIQINKSQKKLYLIEYFAFSDKHFDLLYLAIEHFLSLEIFRT